jgi:hypothetical protein
VRPVVWRPPVEPSPAEQAVRFLAAVGGGPGGGHDHLDGTRPAQGPGRDRGAAGAGQATGTAIVAAQAAVPQLAASSVKAALDRDWDDPAARDAAVAEVLGLAAQVEAFVARKDRRSCPRPALLRGDGIRRRGVAPQCGGGAPRRSR